MSVKCFLGVSGVVFTVVGIMHGLRVALGWPVTIGSWSAPMWASVVALVVSGYLAWSAFALRSKSV